MTMFSTVVSVASISIVSAAMLYLIWFSRKQSQQIRRISEQVASNSLTSDDVKSILSNELHTKRKRNKKKTKALPDMETTSSSSSASTTIALATSTTSLAPSSSSPKALLTSGDDGDSENWIARIGFKMDG